MDNILRSLEIEVGAFILIVTLDPYFVLWVIFPFTLGHVLLL